MGKVQQIETMLTILGSQRNGPVGELSSEENADLNEQDGSTSLIEPLSTQELQELESMDDGSLGFLSIEDIISIRAAIKYKIAEMVRSNEQNLFEHKKEKQSYLSYLKTFISEDDEASGEYERLLSMLEKSIHLLQEPKMKLINFSGKFM